MGNKKAIDIKYGDLDIYIDKQLILHIGQVSDDNIINLFLYPEGNIVKSIMAKEDKNSKCTHELLTIRKEN